MGLFHAIADHRNPRSIAARLRSRRHALLQRLLAPLPRPFRVLDVGGRQAYWEAVAPGALDGITIVLLNTEAASTTRPGFTTLQGDARAMTELANQSFEVVFSNSVIEHVGGRTEQRRMANEIQRVGQRYYVQTPNRWFPMEPHFLIPGFQFLPISARVALVQRFRLGWMPRLRDAVEARECVESIQLLTAGDLLALFPGATLHREQLGVLTKSLIVTGGFAG